MYVFFMIRSSYQTPTRSFISSYSAVFLHLWVPLVQRIMDEYVAEKNSYCTRSNKKSALPTGVPPDVAYHLATDYGGTEGLIPVPAEVVQRLLDDVYPDRDQLFMVSPPRFHTLIEELVMQTGWSGVEIDMANVWDLYAELLSKLDDMELDLDELAEVPSYNDDDVSNYESESDETDNFIEHDK